MLLTESPGQGYVRLLKRPYLDSRARDKGQSRVEGRKPTHRQVSVRKLLENFGGRAQWGSFSIRRYEELPGRALAGDGGCPRRT